MARPGKAIFDVTMMAGWAFAAVLTCLVALSMVDRTGEPATNSSEVASLENADTRLVTGSVPVGQNSALAAPQPSLVKEQNQSFDPFSKTSDDSGAQMRQLMAQFNALQQEVQAFHVTTQRLRDENNQLKQRLANLEVPSEGRDQSVRVVGLPTRQEDTNPIVLRRVDVAEGVTSQTAAQQIDHRATGSIAPVATLPQKGQVFDPFAQSAKADMKLSAEPLVMDVKVEDSSGKLVMPETTARPSKRYALAEGIERPLSQVISDPASMIGTTAPFASQTAFGLDMGQFVSITDLGFAWKELSLRERELIGDLKPLSRVTQKNSSELALKLVLGPIQNAAKAATLCAQLNYRNYECKVSTYHGQALALQ